MKLNKLLKWIESRNWQYELTYANHWHQLVVWITSTSKIYLRNETLAGIIEYAKLYLIDNDPREDQWFDNLYMR